MVMSLAKLVILGKRKLIYCDIVITFPDTIGINLKIKFKGCILN